MTRKKKSKDVTKHETSLTSPLAAQTYGKLLQAIRMGEYSDRTRLPSEAEMASLFGVSRPVLRQALKRMRSEGIISSTRGSGNFVTQKRDATISFVPLSNIQDVQRCLEFRCVLESEASATAARRRTAENLDVIESAMQHYQELNVAGEDAAIADFEFHFAVIQAANNQYYLQTMKALRDEIIFSINLIRSLAANAGSARLSKIMNEHQRIIEAIRNSDPDAARQATSVHLQAGIKRLFLDDNAR